MDFEKALKFRHACKIFDESRKISANDFEKILEAGRLAPSSFGIEQWELEVIRDSALREKIKKACWDQPQITTCSELIVIYAKIAELKADSSYIRESFSRKTNKSKEQTEAYIQAFSGFSTRFLDERDIYGWSKAQCFLCAQNMMMQAAILEIDSCAIEGYIEDELNAVLGIDPKQKRVAMLLPLGYRVNAQSPQIRRELKDIVKYR